MATDDAPDGEIPSVDARVVRTRTDVLGTVLEVLFDEGWDAVTHQHVAAQAGYARGTLYTHWPTRAILVQEAFDRFPTIEHHEPTGDLRADLVAELGVLRQAMTELRLDRGVAVLLDQAFTVPELVHVRDRLVAEGERGVRRILDAALPRRDATTATALLCGAVWRAGLMQAAPTSDTMLVSLVDVVLAGLATREESGPRSDG